MSGIRELRYGRIILAEVTDRRGNRKALPCIIITPTDRIQSAESLLVTAITTSFPDPPPLWHVPLPWNNDPRKVITQLAQRSAAVVGWLDQIRVEDILDVKGDVPRKHLREIERLQWELDRARDDSGRDVD